MARPLVIFFPISMITCTPSIGCTDYPFANMHSSVKIMNDKKQQHSTLERKSHQTIA